MNQMLLMFIVTDIYLEINILNSIHTYIVYSKHFVYFKPQQNWEPCKTENLIKKLYSQ